MSFHPPVADIALALSVAGHDALLARGFPDLDVDTARAVLEAAALFCAGELAPLNRVGDREGARFANGAVTAAPGFAEAYKAYSAGGWGALAAEPEFGGQGLTRALATAVFEMVSGANLAFSLCPMLTDDGIEALTRFGTERHKRIFLPRLVSGEWTGTMNLTEPQSGSDLSGITTMAHPDGEGGWRLNGQKIFITWGDHDLAENVCHMVLARTPGAPAGLKGISLFLSPKFLVDDEGRPGARNGWRAASIEHKLGIHGSPTCVMLYEDAQAELVGELNQGLMHMFVMMNAARLQVGMQGVGVAERAYQQALAYAHERRQGRSPWSGESPAAIRDHPDVRRTLMLMKAKTEAARGICLTTAVLTDLARVAREPQERAAAQARVDLLTPIAKAWSTDVGVEVASAGLQVHGGMGFIEETGAAQHYRDVRITAIYEGANGIHGIDLATRKLKDGAAAMRALTAEMALTAEGLTESPALASAGRRLAQAIAALEKATDWIVSHQGPDALAGATAYLRLAGEVIGGGFLCKQALAAGTEEKAALARIYASQVLTLAPGLAESVAEGAADLEAWSA